MANWATKRRWVDEAFAALERAGYHIGSAYTAVKNPAKTTFVYRDRLWQGADLVGLGVASFGHVNGVHMQNLDTWDKYSEAIGRDEIPLARAYRPTAEERMIREFVLQLKRGALRPDYFATKYGVDVLERFAEPLASLQGTGYLAGADQERDRAHARRAAARGRPAAPLLPAAARGDSIYLTAFLVLGSWLFVRSRSSFSFFVFR